MRIIQRIDQIGDEEVERSSQLENAQARAKSCASCNSLFQGPAQPQEAPGMAVKVVADERTNSVLISGERSQRLR